MALWEVFVVGDRPRPRPVCTAIVWADNAQAAIRVVELEHEGETSFGLPLVVTEARPLPEHPSVIAETY